MGATASKPTTSTSISTSPYHHQPDAPFSGSTREKSAVLLADLLTNLMGNGRLHLTYTRRLALIESIRHVKENKQMLTEIVMEGILTSPTLSDFEKDLIVREGLLEQRWDHVWSSLASQASTGTCVHEFECEFLNYRRMFLNLLRTSRKLQSLPEASRKRLKAMILRTNCTEQLDDLLTRALDRTLGFETTRCIMEDILQLRYYRLLWSDRLDCQEDAVNITYMSAARFTPYGSSVAHPISTGESRSEFLAKKMIYGKILLPSDNLESIDACPICLDPVKAPALQLSCKHVFCGRCIGGWIDKESPVTSTSSSVPNKWSCPVCRREYHGTG